MSINLQETHIKAGRTLIILLSKLEILMVIYPRTGHVPSEPKLLLDVMERILAWMELYLAHMDR